MENHTTKSPESKYQLFDALAPDERRALEMDIRKRGVQVTVELDEDGHILDGHTRVEIADELGLPYETLGRHFETEEEKLEHVIKLNMARRHLGPVRWGQAFKRLCEVRGVKTSRGPKQKDPNSNSATVAEIAGELGASERTVRHRVSQANAFDALPKKQQKAIREGETTLVKTKTENRRRDRNTKIAEAAKTTTPLADLECLGNILLCDPPWRYEHCQSESRAIENQYPTLTLDQLMCIPVSDKCTRDAMLFLWATSPKLGEAIQLLEAWGFVYRTCAVWDKEKIGMGYYFRQQHELLLVAMKGNVPSPSAKARQPSVFRAPRDKKHSKKPECVYEIIEAMYPDLVKLELFARQPRDGWNSWGNQL